MDETESDRRLNAVLTWWGRVAVGAVLAVAVVNWVGWASGLEQLTRIFASWPQMTPWTAVLVAALGVSILVQMGHPSSARVRFGAGLAVLVGVLAVVFLAEYLTRHGFGLDGLWFPDQVHQLQATWPGRPSPQTAVSVLLLSFGVAVMRVDHRWAARLAWGIALGFATIVPFVVTAAYLFKAISLVGVTRSTGMGIATALAVQLLVAAAVLARPDRRPIAWLLARPDRWSLVRLASIIAALPLLLGLTRLVFLMFGLDSDAALVLSVSVITVVVGVATFHLSQREQKVLIEKERLSRERADAEAHYRLLADNAVDVIQHLRDRKITWISPSVKAAFGNRPEQWIGQDFFGFVHPDDLNTMASAQQRLATGQPSVERFRIRSGHGNYHWVDCHCKPYINDAGENDGVIAALRIVDEQVEAQRKLEQLARFDTVTGLTNRAETIARLKAAIDEESRVPGPHLGVLFCDIDHFKTINDTFGHSAGDLVLATLAARIRECVRKDDTVGRIGGDEIMVLLPGLHNLDEAVRIGEKIRLRTTQPICHGSDTIQCTISIGATLSKPGESTSALMARSDIAMYQAKQAGRNTVTPI